MTALERAIVAFLPLTLSGFSLWTVRRHEIHRVEDYRYQREIQWPPAAALNAGGYNGGSVQVRRA